jgi:DNA mismatch repair protein MutL
VWWVDVAAAHFRIRYEALQRQAHTGPLPSQQLLYPFSLKLDASAQLALAEALPHLRETGFELEIIGNGDVLVSGLPSGLRPAECAPLLDELLAHWAESGAVPDRLRSRALMSLARQGALAANKQLPAAERAQLLADLMNCAEPAYTPDGHRTYVALTAQDIEALFKG